MLSFTIYFQNPHYSNVQEHLTPSLPFLYFHFTSWYINLAKTNTCHGFIPNPRVNLFDFVSELSLFILHYLIWLVVFYLLGVNLNMNLNIYFDFKIFRHVVCLQNNTSDLNIHFFVLMKTSYQIIWSVHNLYKDFLYVC